MNTAVHRLKYTSIRLSIFASILSIVGLCFGFGLTAHYFRQHERDYAEAVHQALRMQTATALLSVGFLASYGKVSSNDKKGLAGALNLLNQQASTIQSLLRKSEHLTSAFKRHSGTNGDIGWVRLATNVNALTAQIEKLYQEAEGGAETGRPASIGPAIDEEISANLIENLRDNIEGLEETGVETYMNLVWLARVSSFINVVNAILIGLAMMVFGVVLYNRLMARRNEVLAFVQSVDDADGINFRRVVADDEFSAIEVGLTDYARAMDAKRVALLEERELAVKDLADRGRVLERTNAGLRDTGKAFIRFLTDISHDLRTPLAIIRGESEIVLKGANQSIAEYRTALGRVVEQTDYLSSLVDQLLLTARSRVASTSLDAETFDLIELVDAACDDMRILAKKKSIELVRTGFSGRELVFGDRVRLREMLLSVIDNALNYSSAQSTVTVSVEKDQNTLRLAVADRGIGISGEDLPNIFKRFYRAQNAISINSGGTGIGLAVVKGIVEAHGGKIDISSELGTGTTVLVELPAADAWQKQEEAS